MSDRNLRIRPSGKYFSPGNTKSIAGNVGYHECIKYWSKNAYVLRYSGGMAPDCYHIFKKGEGVFTSVADPPKIGSKLRALYECIPIAFLVEKAGGSSSDGTTSLLDMKITGLT